MALRVIVCYLLSFYSCYYFFFFFSSRRRHTRCYRDWSSDVCSSDLVGILLDRAAALGAGLRVLPVGPPVGTLGAVEHRDAVAPPQLPRDVPVPDVLHPVLVRRAPPLGDETNGPAAVRFERRLRERLHFHEPLIGQPRLHHRVAAIAVAHRVPA